MKFLVDAHQHKGSLLSCSVIVCHYSAICTFKLIFLNQHVHLMSSSTIITVVCMSVLIMLNAFIYWRRKTSWKYPLDITSLKSCDSAGWMRVCGPLSKWLNSFTARKTDNTPWTFCPVTWGYRLATNKPRGGDLTEPVSYLQWWLIWTAGYMHGHGREAFCQGALRRTPNLSSLRAAISWRSRTCRRTGTTLVMEGWEAEMGNIIDDMEI